jgi:SAM-dependent methyltransferase
LETSSFFDAARPAIRATRALGPVLDLACGRGRHALACVADGLPTLALDRDGEALAQLMAADRAASAHARAGATRAALLCACCDLEAGLGIPVRTASCGAILVFRFLFRPLADAIAEALAPGGLLVYETFTRDQRELGYGPRRDAFLLTPGELPGLFPSLEVVAYDEGLIDAPTPRHTARLIARKPRASA